jgi:WD40 repeat protein
MANHQARIVSTSRFLGAVIAGLWIALLPGIAAADRPVRYAWFVDFSPDGTSLVTSYGGWLPDEGGEIRVWGGMGTLRWKATHERGLRASAWSPQGKIIACGSYGGDVVLFDAESGEQKLEISIAGDFAEMVQITPDQQYVIAATGTGMLWIWETATGKRVKTIPTHTDSIWGMRLASDGQMLATGGRDRTVRVTNIKTGQQLQRLDHPGVSIAVAFTPDGRQLVTGCHDAQIRVWDLKTGKVTRTLTGHRGSVNDLDFSSDGKRLVSSSSDRTIRVWDFESGGETATLEGHEKPVYGVRFSPNDKQIASAGWDETVRIWDVETQTELLKLQR